MKIDKNKTVAKWAPILESMGVSEVTRKEWMSEMAEYAQLNENAYANASLAGMGAVYNPGVSTVPGQLGTSGSGDIAQNMLPVAMKIAAQTIGLDLVAVKPTAGPKIDLMYMDFHYDDVADPAGQGRPQVFMVEVKDATAKLDTITSLKGAMDNNNIKQTIGGLVGGRLFMNITDGTMYTEAQFNALTSMKGIVEFLGFSRIYGYPMFRAFRQHNAWGAYAYQYTEDKNTFDEDTPLIEQIKNIAGEAIATSEEITVSLVSALDDHLPGFVTNFLQDNGKSPMNRQEDDETYANNIGPKVETKTIAVGTIQVASSLRRTDIEDIKANAGIDILQKMESVLVNELSQTISKQIVSKIWEMGDKNRESAPLAATQSVPGKNDLTIFDLDTSYVGAVGGETTHAVQRKLTTKMRLASHFIATDGRIGVAHFAVTNGAIAASLVDIQSYTLNPVINSSLNTDGQLYPVGKVGGIEIYVDPYQYYGDNRMVLGRKNTPEQPGIIFVPYLMAQSFQVVSEATFTPRILLRSRYAVAEVGFYPHKQYMSMEVYDEAGLLN